MKLKSGVAEVDETFIACLEGKGKDGWAHVEGTRVAEIALIAKANL